MTKAILICGHGPGISDATAKKFGKEGFSVGLVARNPERLATAVAALEASGVKAKAFPADLADPTAAAALLSRVRAELGPVTVLHWNAYPAAAGDLLSASIADLRGLLDFGVTSLLATVQAALPDLRAAKDPAILVTGGGLSAYHDQVDAMAVAWGSMGLALTKAAQHKAVGLLGAKLAAEGIYVGEVTVKAIVKGTSFDRGQGTLEAGAVAEEFWKLYQGRKVRYVDIG